MNLKSFFLGISVLAILLTSAVGFAFIGCNELDGSRLYGRPTLPYYVPKT